jgi:hypothetical protein
MTTINVTAEHIAKGQPSMCADCPVALAIKDALPGLWSVLVGPKIGIVPTRTSRATTWLALPPDVQDFIWDFDDSGRGEPFTFELDYPAEVAA